MSDKSFQKSGVVLERLRQLIDTKTREEIAKQLKCDTSLVTKHYNGKREVTPEYVVKYARYFSVSTDYLFGITEHKTPIDSEEGEIVRVICDYTGLNKSVIEKLHSIAEPLLENAEDYEFDDFFITEEMFSDRREYILKKLSIINFLLNSDHFVDAICMIMNYIEGMIYRTNSINRNIEDSRQKDIVPTVSYHSTEKDTTFRLQYFEALECFKIIIDNYTKETYNQWKKAEEKQKFIFDYVAFREEALNREGSKNTLTASLSDLTDIEKEELFVLRENVKRDFFSLINIEGDIYANDNETK